MGNRVCVFVRQCANAAAGQFPRGNDLINWLASPPARSSVSHQQCAEQQPRRRAGHQVLPDRAPGGHEELPRHGRARDRVREQDGDHGADADDLRHELKGEGLGLAEALRLGRLRELLDDPLLVRVGRAMQPTPRALALEAPIRHALQQIEHSLIAGEAFDPARSHQRFRIAVSDYVELICMPALMRRLAERAPGIQLAIQHLTPTLPTDALDNGEVDLVLGRFLDVPSRFHVRHWASETLQVAVRRAAMAASSA